MNEVSNTLPVRTDEGPSFAIDASIDDPLRPENTPDSNSIFIRNQSTAVADCRMCLQSDQVSNLLKPCACDGTLLYCHYSCLESWVQESRKLKCEICAQSYKPEIKQKLANTIARAEQRDQEHRNASLEAQLEAIANAQYENTERRTPRCRVSIYIFVFVAFAFVAFRIQSSGAFPPWLGNLLEILVIAVPIYFIVKLLYAVQRYRTGRSENINS